LQSPGDPGGFDESPQCAILTGRTPGVTIAWMAGTRAAHAMNPDSRMLRWLKVVLLGCTLGLLLVAINLALWSFFMRAYPPGRARSAPFFQLSADPVKQQLVGVINSQLSAFRKGDYAGAYGLADSALRAQVSPATFQHMVENAYPAIARSRSASFGVILDNGDEAVVNVGITSQAGRMLQYRYILRREPAGWKISGVIRIPGQGTTI
jgi:hypothetical protein